MASTLKHIETKSPAQVRDDMLRGYSNDLIREGIANPDVSEGTEIYVKFTAISNEISVAAANFEIKADAMMPDSALGENGEDLIRIGAALGLAPRGATGSTGPIVFANTITGSSLVATGSQLLDPQGLAYEVSVGGSFSTDDTIQILSTDTGRRTNLAEGVTLRWTTTPPFAESTVVVGPGGLSGGSDAETMEDFRLRVLERYRTPPSGGNAAHVAVVAEAASSAVQKAFPYPAYNGPGTFAVALVGAATDSDKTRDVPASVVTEVLTALQAEFPDFVDIIVQSAVSEEASYTSVALDLDEDSGWLDATPFPVYSSGYANVTAVTDSLHFTVNSDVAPTAGTSQIVWLSWSDWKIYRARVTASSGTGPYAVTVDRPLVGIAVGDVISPDAQNMDAYFAAVLDAFAKMGPGEKTANLGLLPRALRRPRPSQGWPQDLNAILLKFVAATGDEVLDADYLYLSTPSPTTPASVATAPNVLVPKHIGFYPAS